MREKEEVCANCGMPYRDHFKGGYCMHESGAKWFPKAIADAIESGQNKAVQP